MKSIERLRIRVARDDRGVGAINVKHEAAPLGIVEGPACDYPLIISEGVAGRDPRGGRTSGMPDPPERDAAAEHW